MKQKVLRKGVVLSCVLAIGAAGCTPLTREQRIRHLIETDYSVDDPQFRTSMSNLMRAPLVDGNNIAELLNGDRIFSSMEEAIKQAQKSITMEMYIWSSGNASSPFVELLAEKARAGVSVKVVIDAVGSGKLKRSDILKMTTAGVQLTRYNPIVSFKFFRTNYRTHRKLLIVDGRVGFIGGVCINDEWQGNAEPPHWRDTMLRVEGPVVGQMQAVFSENWMQTKSEVIQGEKFFPDPKNVGTMSAQCVKSGPFEDAEITRLSFLMSIAAARKSIRISHAYFAPDTLMIETLLAARRRGVQVEIIVPHKIDNFILKKASRPRWGKLLKAGVEFYEYQPTLYHCKIMIVDDVWSIVGSVNFDERSFKLNDETDLDVYDKDLAAQLIRSFNEDKSKSKRLRYEDLGKRNFLSKIFDNVAGLFRSQL